jgi:cytochrome P450
MSSTSWSPIVYDPFEVNDDPYPIFARLRAEDPAYCNAARDIWMITRFADVQTASRTWRTFSSGKGVVLDDESDFYAPGGFVDQDPPPHDRLRKVVAPYFTPKATAKLADYVRKRTRSLLEPVRAVGAMDVVGDIARPLPTDVVSRILGVPEADHALVASWFVGMLERIPGQVDAPASAWSANRMMRDYMTELVAERRIRPQDDLTTIIAEAHGSGEVSHAEAVGMCVFMYYAGIITTAGLIANSILNLLDFPDQLDALRSGSQPMAAAVEELLRYDAPIQSLRRVLLEPVTIHGKRIPAGADVLLVWAAANRDERRWPDPDRIDIGRPARRHLAFGEGIHHCLGAPLARLEAAIVFEEMLAMMPRYELSGPIVRLHTPHERGLRSLPIAFEAG